MGECRSCRSRYLRGHGAHKRASCRRKATWDSFDGLKLLSPIGESVSESIRRHARRSVSYRREQARLTPFEAVARTVIRRRIDLNLTQEQLAKRVGTSLSSISRIERGQYPNSKQMLLRLAAALELDTSFSFSA
jgi:DNA-binding XRE family transcriptional regulator